MPIDTESRLRDELTERLEEVTEQRKALEARLRDELEGLRDEETRLRGAIRALTPAAT